MYRKLFALLIAAGLGVGLSGCPSDPNADKTTNTVPVQKDNKGEKGVAPAPPPPPKDDKKP